MKRPRRNSISRRDFVQGKFLRAFGRWSMPHAGTIHGTRRRPPSGLVIRYPKSSADLERTEQTDRPANPVESLPPTTARRRTIPVLRPPGAVEEVEFLERCTRCNECATACPHDAIVAAPQRLREAAGTPIIDPDHQPCQMCDGFPCIEACEPDVLTRLVPVMMGTARITEHLCMTHHGSTCTTCVESCPVEGAIMVTNGKPHVDQSTCTGCGVCRYVCPAPENAILLMPTLVRPTPYPDPDEP